MKLNNEKYEYRVLGVEEGSQDNKDRLGQKVKMARWDHLDRQANKDPWVQQVQLDFRDQPDLL